MKTVPRLIIQIAISDDMLVALADDGTLWTWGHDGRWSDYIPPLPVREVKDDKRNGPN